MSQPFASVSLRRVCLLPRCVNVNEVLRDSYVVIYGISALAVL